MARPDFYNSALKHMVNTSLFNKFGLCDLIHSQPATIDYIIGNQNDWICTVNHISSRNLHYIRHSREILNKNI